MRNNFPVFQNPTQLYHALYLSRKLPMLVNALRPQICLAVGRTLTSLDLSGCTLTDSGLSSISKHCQVIESLKVSFCPNITGMKLKPLFTCPRRGPDFKTFVANGCKMVSFEQTFNLILSEDHSTPLSRRQNTRHCMDRSWSGLVHHT